MDDRTRERLEAFLRPLYQDLDGVSRADEAERIATIAGRLVTTPDDSFELLARFHLLGRWLEKVGNASRTSLATGIDEAALRRTSAAIRSLDAPMTAAERAIASAVVIDGAGLRGLADRFARARREGHSVVEVAREALAETDLPEWMSDEAKAEVAKRRQTRNAFCRALLEEEAE